MNKSPHSTTTATPEEADRREFLTLLFGEEPAGLIEVRPILPNGDKLASARLRAFAPTIDDALAAIDRAAKAGANIYVGVATRRDASSGEKSNLHTVRAAWVDADLKSDEDRAEFFARLEACPFKPSLIVETGGGVHVYWIFDKPLSVDAQGATYDSKTGVWSTGEAPEGIAKLEAINRG